MIPIANFQVYCTSYKIPCVIYFSGMFILLFFVLLGIVNVIWYLIWKNSHYIKVKPVNEYPHQCNIEVTNEYDKDLTDLLIELKRLTIIGYRTDCKVNNVKPYFLSGERNDGNKIRAKDTAKINIAQIPPGEENKIFVEFLIEGGWKGNYAYHDISSEAEERKKRIGKTSGVVYEFVIEITGKIEGEYIIPQVYCGRLVYLAIYDHEGEKGINSNIQWMRLDKYPIEKDKLRAKFRPDEDVISSKEDFWRLFRKAEQGERIFSMKTNSKQPEKKKLKKTTPKKEAVLTKNDFFKALDKVIGVVKKKSPSKGKSKTSE